MIAIVIAATVAPVAGALPTVSPEQAGMSGERLAQIDGVARSGIDDGQMAGCVVLVAQGGKTVFHRAYGHRQVEPAPIDMTADTLFDLASITKPLATATSVMMLVEQGKLDLADRVADHLPEFAAGGKRNVTVYHLLTHQGGLIADNSLKDYADGPEKAWARILATQPIAPPGERFVYTDVGFLVLGRLVEKISGQSLDRFTRQHIYQPLGMTETGFLPPAALRKRAAATEQRAGRWMVGEVHDPRSYALGGVAGHAGLFATAADLAVFGQMMLGNGAYGDARVLRPETVAAMTAPRNVGTGLRGLGWDVRSGYSSNRGVQMSDRAFGHGGFTGTSLWIDPRHELIVVFLSTRLHPDGRGAVNPIAGRIGSIAVEAIDNAEPRPADTTAPADPPVLTGIDVLRRDGFTQLAGRRVGLITNHTGIDRRGASTVRLLHEADNVNLVALFSPEHGIAGKLDVPRIDDDRHAQSGLPVFSLYGATRRPTAEQLEGIDTLVFDIQDIGTRFYTYAATMKYAMQAAAEHKLRFVVLDRPNPINGVDVAGPVLDAGSESFVGFHRVPLRHGMTMGELARMMQAELSLPLDLQVVAMDGWRRALWFDATGLPWVDPSPNMRSLAEALLYPGIGLLETTNVSVGRGTDTPFERIGAPWIDGTLLAERLRAQQLPGVVFVPIRFTPASSTHRGQACGGVNIICVDRSRFRPVRTGLEIARQLRLLYPNQWNAAAYGRLLKHATTLQAVMDATPVERIAVSWKDDLAEFERRRAEFLLYE